MIDTQRAADAVSPLDRIRQAYQPRLPRGLSGSIRLHLDPEPLVSDYPAQILEEFPNSLNKPVVRFVQGEGGLTTEAITVGVVFSGGQAPGGHNVIAGLLDALKSANPESRLIGFLDGPIGIVKDNWIELTPELVQAYRNTGGFDMIGSGRDKIEKAADLAACKKTLESHNARGLVVIGGDDSNTNAAVMAEYFLQQKSSVQVIGAPKTIDGDLKNDLIDASFGFDTAAKVYSELAGSICRDSASARKYYHFIRLMGRAASHVTLEVALQIHPNLTIISEEAEAAQWTLEQVVDQIVDVVVRRSAAGKNYGVIVIPEGLLEFLADVKVMISELSDILAADESHIKTLKRRTDRVDYFNQKMSPAAAATYAFLPDSIQLTLLKRDKHGNIPLSQVETEELLMGLVSQKLKALKSEGKYSGSFSPLGHFFGYEGRCVQPSNFDADYCYALGYTGAQLIRGGVTGYTISAQNLAAPVEDWQMGGVPVTSMLVIEQRKGKPKPVIKKTLVDLQRGPFRYFASHRGDWVEKDAFLYPGPIQYFGPSDVCDARTKTLELEAED
ncbi:MAG: diphosphate--fructose-6-phosphate 1-phosphotransferase [Armatimonadetes bacterium]|nr:diphosphate--fructose-6-phosphate 1-phosphotransferase [Armatimonadota bacterium]